MTDQRWYSIGEVAAAFGVAVSTLRYYDDIGLVPAPRRQANVRYYDRRALELLAYAQLWRLDGSLSIEQTSAILTSTKGEERNELLARSREELAERIRRLQDAHDVLEHTMRCTHDEPLNCPVMSTLLNHRVEAALSGSSGRYGNTDDGKAMASVLHELAMPVLERIRNSGGDPKAHAMLDRPGVAEPD